MTRKVILAACSIAIVLICGFLGWRLFVVKPLPPHTGDGVFEDLSRRMLFAVPGYSVSFPELDLGKHYESTFRFTRLPVIGEKCYLYFAINDSDVDVISVHAKARGALCMELRDEQGRIVIGAKGHLVGSFSEGYWRGAFRFSQIDNSFFPEPATMYTLRVTYYPDDKSVSGKGYPYIECGGPK
jgi:hypothetical protein